MKRAKKVLGCLILAMTWVSRRWWWYCAVEWAYEQTGREPSEWD